MRRVLVDYARTKNPLKRGGADEKLNLDAALTVVAPLAKPVRGPNDQTGFLQLIVAAFPPRVV